MKKIFYTLILGLSAMLHGQNKISGVITDNNNVALSDVSVYAPELHKSTLTGSDGKYELNNVPSGNMTIIFSHVNFGTRHQTVQITAETIYDVVMTESVHQMDEVIVSTAFNKLQSQNVMKVEHRNIKSMQQKGVSTLIEGLTTVPGIEQVSTGVSIGKPVIRGLSANRVLVYSQGVRLENQQFGDEHGLGLNDSGIESVEIIKGPASLLYGSDAIGGVLYFNPEKFADKNTLASDFGQRLFSNTLGSNSSLGLKGSTENWKFLGRGNYATHSDYRIPNGNRVTNTRYNETDFKAGIGYSDSNFATVMRYNFNNLNLGIPEEGIAVQSQNKNPQYPRQGVYNHILSLHNNIFFGNSTLDADFGYIFNDRSEFEDSEAAILHMKLKTFNYDLKYHFAKFKKIQAIIGAQGMFQTNVNSGAKLLIPDASTVDFGIFGTANYDWQTGIIQAGLRYDNRGIKSDQYGNQDDESYFKAVDKSFNSVNASLGYKSNLAKNVSLRVNLASGFRAPNLAELTSNGVHEGTNRYEIGNSDLKTEQNFQADLNLEYNSSHFEFFINGFYNLVNNYIFTSPTGTFIEENEVFNYIQTDASLYGGEAGIHLHPHPLDWLHLESSFESVTGKRESGDYLPLIPANSWSNTLRAEFKMKNWLSEGYARINVSSTFGQRNVSGFESQTPGYTLLNAGFGGKIKINNAKFELNLNGNNLFDKTYIAHLSRLKTDGIPNIGRNIVLGINFSI